MPLSQEEVEKIVEKVKEKINYEVTVEKDLDGCLTHIVYFVVLSFIFRGCF